MPTEITDRKLYERRNTDNIFTRSVIGGLLMTLNNTLYFDQIWDDSTGGIERITVPFYFDLGNPTSERFLQDNYLTFGSKCGFKKINGNFDMIPRGVVSLTGCTIQAESITNIRVMGEYQRMDENGEMKGYVSYLYSIPCQLTFNCEIRCNSFVEMLKIDQACREFFYKNKTYYVVYKGMKIPCRVGFPESYMGDKQSGYTMGGSDVNNDPKVTFQVQVESYQPVFDPTTEMLASNKIKGFGTSVKIENKIDSSHEQKSEPANEQYSSAPDSYTSYNFVNETDRNVLLYNNFDDYSDYIDTFINGGNEVNVYNDGVDTYSLSSDSLDTDKQKEEINSNKLYVIDAYNYAGKSFPAGMKMPLRWGQHCGQGDILDIIIAYDEITDSSVNNSINDSSSNILKHFSLNGHNYKYIDIIRNHMFYDWAIPNNFTGNALDIDVMIPNTDNVTVWKMPEIKAIPDSSGNISENSFFINEKGYFIVNKYSNYYPEIKANDVSTDIFVNYIDRNGESQTLKGELYIRNGVVKCDRRNHPVVKIDTVQFNKDYKKKLVNIGVFQANNKNINFIIPRVTII